MCGSEMNRNLPGRVATVEVRERERERESMSADNKKLIHNNNTLCTYPLRNEHFYTSPNEWADTST